ncbi:MAG: hypothetical protein ACYCW6_21395 [Candidatus Xenobia bacterium]
MIAHTTELATIKRQLAAMKAQLRREAAAQDKMSRFAAARDAAVTFLSERKIAPAEFDAEVDFMASLTPRQFEKYNAMKASAPSVRSNRTSTPEHRERVTALAKKYGHGSGVHGDPTPEHRERVTSPAKKSGPQGRG